MPSFQYKRVLVVGATSGIGWAMAARFVQEGSHVVVVGRRKERLEEFVHEHGKEKATAVPFDISETDKIPAFVQNITRTYPDLDCVWLNSGVQRSLHFDRPDTVDLQTVADEMHTNYFSIVALTHAFLPFLLAANHPRALLYTTSNLAIVPLVRAPNYSASKAALHAFILCIRAQLGGVDGLRVIELLPPAVQTELHDAKHQPELGDGGKSFGMPLAQFTDEAYASLVAGQETINIGAQGPMDGLVEMEAKRQDMFSKLNEAARQHS